MEQTENLKLWLPAPSDPLDVEVLDENFEKLDEGIEGAAANAFKVGDILTTIRTDLGDDWALCNGSIFDPDEYPDLAANGPSVISTAKSSTKIPILKPEELSHASSKSSPGANFFTTDGNGRWMYVCYTSDANWNAHYSLVYSDDDFATCRVFPHELNSSYGGPTGIWYANGYFIVSWSGNIYATTGDPDNPDWQKATASTELKTETIPLVEYVDGKYYAHIVYTSAATDPKIVEADNPLFSGQIVHTVVHTNLFTATNWRFVRTKNFYVYAAYNGSAIMCFVYSSDPLGPWQEILVACYATTYISAVDDTVFFNGTGTNLGLTSTEGAIMWVNIDDSNDGITHRMIGPQNVERSYVFRAAGKYYALNLSGILFYLGDLIQDGTIYDSINVTKDILGLTVATVALPAQNIWRPIIQTKNYISAFNSIGFTSGMPTRFTIPFYAVPNISVDNAYAYIKVKSGLQDEPAPIQPEEP